MGILGPLNDTKISPRENELKALSTFFSKSCLVGKWSPDDATNQRLSKYCVHSLHYIMDKIRVLFVSNILTSRFTDFIRLFHLAVYFY